MEGKLVKIDKYGSKHYEGMVTCPRCGGSGVYIHHIENGVPIPNWNYGGMCLKCEGEGKVLDKWVERTPEHEAVLAKQRQAREDKKKAEHDAKIDQIRKDWLINHGWDAEGFTFLFTGDTFAIKDTIKEMGGKFDTILGWHIDHLVEGYELMKVTVDQMMDQTYWGYEVKVSRDDADQMKKDFVSNLHPKAHTSEFIGTVGERLKNLELTLTFQTSVERDIPRHYRGWETVTTYIYSFKDAQGNIFTYFTSSILEYFDEFGILRFPQEGNTYKVSGTVKEHKEYKGDKQTVLQRCKISK